jgi:CYTH domain-containing protein
MGKEIERKFLVRGEEWRDSAGEGRAIRQGYLAIGPPAAVRVRLDEEKGPLISIKSSTHGLERAEYEYAIPEEEAKELLGMSMGCIIDKRRYKIEHGGKLWEVDEFHGENEGLVLAEVEMENTEENVTTPNWAADEVTGDPRFYNANLAEKPFSRWA